MITVIFFKIYVYSYTPKIIYIFFAPPHTKQSIGNISTASKKRRNSPKSKHAHVLDYQESKLEREQVRERESERARFSILAQMASFFFFFTVTQSAHASAGVTIGRLKNKTKAPKKVSRGQDGGHPRTRTQEGQIHTTQRVELTS